MKFLHLNYHHHSEYNSPEEVIEKHRLSSGFVDHIKQEMEFISVKHMENETSLIVEGVPYYFFRTRNRSWYIPFKTHRLVKSQQPDIILVEGFIFPLQVLFLRTLVGKHCVIIAQHHAERPSAGIRGLFQKWADRAI